MQGSKEDLHCSDNPNIEFIHCQIPVDMRVKFTSCANNKENVFDDFFVSLYFVPKHAKARGVSLKSLRKICLMPATSSDVQQATENLRYLKHDEMEYPHPYEKL